MMTNTRPGPHKVMARRAAGEVIAACRRCTTEFQASHANSKYCSEKCKTDNWVEVRRLRRQSEPRIELLPKTQQFIARREQLILAQENKCALCGTALSQETTVLDHDHTTGKIRAVLCRRCNIGLGYFKDDVALLEAALNYIRKYKGN